MSMFCYQCQETAGGKGCTARGVCGKTEDVAQLQDLLIYTLKGISEIVTKGKIGAKGLANVNHEMLNSLFMTITNANFDAGAMEKQIVKMIGVRDRLRKSVSAKDCTMRRPSRSIRESPCFKRPLPSACCQPQMRMCARFAS